MNYQKAGNEKCYNISKENNFITKKFKDFIDD